jgi:glycerol-3-phosphate acyltransferase PlsY
VFAGFRGGRGVATAFGGILVLAPVLAVVFLVLGLLVVVATRYMSLMSILVTPIAALILIVTAAAGWTPVAFAIYAIIAMALIEYMHIPNMRRLLSGTEPRIGRGGDRPATG